MKTVTGAQAIPGPVAAAAAPLLRGRTRQSKREGSSDVSDDMDKQEGETEDEREDDEGEDDDEEQEELIREREELRQGLVVATASLDATVKLTSLSVRTVLLNLYTRFPVRCSRNLESVLSAGS